MKYELNFDAMIFAGEVFQCILAGPGDDFFTDEEKNTLSRLQVLLFNESQFGDDEGNGKFDYLTYIGANIRKNSVYYFRMVEAWKYLFSFIMKYKEIISPLSQKIKSFCKGRYNKDKVLNAIDDAITMGLFSPIYFFKYYRHFKYYHRCSIGKVLKKNQALIDVLQNVSKNVD